MIALLRTTSEHADFQKLVVQLDAYLRVIDGEDHAFYSQFNKSNLLLLTPKKSIGLTDSRLMMVSVNVVGFMG